MRAALWPSASSSSAARLAKALHTATARPHIGSRHYSPVMTQAAAAREASAAAAPAASGAAATPALEPIGDRKLRILCLHGYLQNAEVCPGGSMVTSTMPFAAWAGVY